MFFDTIKNWKQSHQARVISILNFLADFDVKCKCQSSFVWLSWKFCFWSDQIMIWSFIFRAVSVYSRPFISNRKTCYHYILIRCYQKVIFNIFAFAYFQNQPSTSGMKYQVLWNNSESFERHQNIRKKTSKPYEKRRVAIHFNWKICNPSLIRCFISVSDNWNEMRRKHKRIEWEKNVCAMKWSNVIQMC